MKKEGVKRKKQQKEDLIEKKQRQRGRERERDRKREKEREIDREEGGKISQKQRER